MRRFLGTGARVRLMETVVVASIATAALLASPVVATAQTQDIVYTFSGVIHVLDLRSPAPGDGTLIPGADPLGMDGATISLVCTIDIATTPSFNGVQRQGGTYAFYPNGDATLTINGAANSDRNGIYTEPCTVRIDDFLANTSGLNDGVSIVTTWPFLGFVSPDVFQVPFADLPADTFSDDLLHPFAASDVLGFVGVNFRGSGDVFYLEPGTASGVLASNDPQSKKDCKKGGWEQYGFKNQGQCIRFVQTGKDGR